MILFELDETDLKVKAYIDMEFFERCSEGLVDTTFGGLGSVFIRNTYQGIQAGLRGKELLSTVASKAVAIKAVHITTLAVFTQYLCNAGYILFKTYNDNQNKYKLIESSNLDQERAELREAIKDAERILNAYLEDESWYPKELRYRISCPISTEIMSEPVITNCGHTYNREHIEQWLNSSGNLTCPLDRREVTKIERNKDAYGTLFKIIKEVKRDVYYARFPLSLVSEMREVREKIENLSSVGNKMIEKIADTTKKALQQVDRLSEIEERIVNDWKIRHLS